METLDAKDVRARLEALGRRDAQRMVFGASSHGYAMQPPLTDMELAAVEGQWGVRFPDDYRTFLLEVGAGGAGPLYGLFSLVSVGGIWRWNGDGGELVSRPSDPFPHTSTWNPTFPERADHEDENAYWEKRNAWEEAVYFHPKQTYGAVCLCHEGCAIRDWLVVTGTERGHMWLDDRGSDGGLMPRESNGRRLTFGNWYLEWLCSAESRVNRH